jgi:hypothetical protein
VCISFDITNFIFNGLVQVRRNFGFEENDIAVFTDPNEGVSTGTIFFNMGVNSVGVQIKWALLIGAFRIGHIASGLIIGSSGGRLRRD